MNILSKFQLSSSSGLGLTVLWIYFHKPSLTLVNDEAVYRTAPATPGLLINPIVTGDKLREGFGHFGAVILTLNKVERCEDIDNVISIYTLKLKVLQTPAMNLSPTPMKNLLQISKISIRTNWQNQFFYLKQTSKKYFFMFNF